MIAINLSGIQSTKNLSQLGLEKEQEVIVRHKPEWDDNELALAVCDQMGNLIGWIPKLETIQKYGEQAKAENNEQKADMQRRRWADTSFIRDHISTDMFRNNINVVGKICRLQEDWETGDILSVSVMFDYM